MRAASGVRFAALLAASCAGQARAPLPAPRSAPLPAAASSAAPADEVVFHGRQLLLGDGAMEVARVSVGGTPCTIAWYLQATPATGHFARPDTPAPRPTSETYRLDALWEGPNPENVGTKAIMESAGYELRGLAAFVLGEEGERSVLCAHIDVRTIAPHWAGALIQLDRDASRVWSYDQETREWRAHEVTVGRSWLHPDGDTEVLITNLD